MPRKNDAQQTASSATPSAPHLAAPLPVSSATPGASTTSAAGQRATTPAIDLALQGGGAHGAFTWGVLDRLLEETDLPIAGISGTSAGAMNAAVLISGWEKGLEKYRDKAGRNPADVDLQHRDAQAMARASAKQALQSFWRDISTGGASWAGLLWPTAAWQDSSDWLNRMLPVPMQQMLSALRTSPFMLAQYNLDATVAFRAFEAFAQMFSPYELNPLDVNPLRDVLKQHVNPERLRGSQIKLFVTATSVQTGRPRVFGCQDLSIDALMASAALPLLFRAVEIDGEAYWDGGYVGNPSIWPLIYGTDADDVVLVRINPLQRDEVPMRAGDIMNRLNEVTFNASLIAEMRAIGFVKRLVQEDRLPREQYRNLRMHMIDAEDQLKPLNASSKMNTLWSFFKQLHEIGRAAAERWIEQHKADIGQRDSIDIEREFLGQPTQPLAGPVAPT